MSLIIEKADCLLRLRNYSPSTRKAYLHYIQEYITFSKSKGLKTNQKAIEEFLLNKQSLKLSPQTINLAINSVKFLYSEVLKDKAKINLKFAKKSHKLLVILSHSEVEKYKKSVVNDLLNY